MKKALSLLLAVLMLVSLFSGMAFADDDVIVEEPAAVDEIVGDDFAEAADAYVEEYTDEGSFEAADELTMSNLAYWMDPLQGNRYPFNEWEIEYMVPANPKCGQLVEVHFRTIAPPHTAVANPTTVFWDHEFGAFDPNDPEGKEVGWETTSIVEATCTTEGVMHQVRECQREGCTYKEERDVKLQRLGHVFGTDPFGADPNGAGLLVTQKAILAMPTTTKKGLGHEACIYCGGLNPDTKDYPIGVHDPEDIVHKDDSDMNFIYGPWHEKVPAHCLENGYEERVCIVPGCPRSQDRVIQALGVHTHDFADPKCAMVFDHIERLNCQFYAEVWVCSNPNCYSKWDPKANNGNGDWVASTTASQFTQYRGAGDKVIGNTLEEAVAAADKGFDYLDRNAKHNTEFYLHHLYTEDWTITRPASCCVDGLMERYCQDPNCPDPDMGHMKYPIPALEPIYGDEVYLGFDDVNNHWYHYKSCTRPECVAGAILEPIFPAYDENQQPIVAKPDDPSYYTQKNNSNKQALVVDHAWGEWKVEVPMTETQRGHLFRTCTVPGCGEREDFFGTQAEFDAKYNPPHPVLTTGIIKDEDGAFKLYKMGVFDKDFTGIYDGYNYVLEKSGKWYVVEGIWENDAMGATLVGSTWYFLANGKVQEVTQLAEYQGKWFYVVNGVIDTSKTALVDYNGGKFVVALGRIVDEYSGLWQNAKSIGGDDSWYYVAKGQVQTQYTGLVQYNGEWFYVENGQMVPYNGEVEYDGEIFNVKEGMVVAA